MTAQTNLPVAGRRDLSDGRNRVLFVNPALHAIGGMQAWLDTLMPDLRTLGWDVWLGLPRGRFNDTAAYLELHPWPQTVFFENPARTDHGRVRGVCSVLSRLAPDLVVVAHGVGVLRAVERLRWLGRGACKVLSSIHSVEPGMLEDIRRFAHVIDGVAAPNRLVEALALQVGGLEPERSMYLPYAVDVDPVIDLSEIGSRIELVYAGRFEEAQKRVSDVPRILRELDARGIDWSLDVAGTGPDGERLASELAALRAPERVRHHGAVPPEVVKSRVLRPGRVLLITSRWELGPVVAWEAFGRGMTAVSSRFVGSGREGSIVEGMTAATFDVGDVAAAARAVEQLADVDRRRALATAAWRVARERYARPVVANAWTVALERTLAMNARRAPCRPAVQPARGRLEGWLGPTLGDLARRAARRPAFVGGPGDEWPHSGGAAIGFEQFQSLAARCDGVAVS